MPYSPASGVERQMGSSVPVTLTGEGVGEILEWGLPEAEREGLEAAAESVREKT